MKGPFAFIQVAVLCRLHCGTADRRAVDAWRGLDLRLTTSAVLFAFICLIGAPPVHAHPHAWIDLRSAVLIDSSGRVTGLEQEWLFDEFYTLFVTEDAVRSPGKPADALNALVSDTLKNLRDYDYFTEARAGGSQVSIDTVREFDVELRSGRLWIRFVVPFVTPVEPTVQAFAFSVFDPTYYIEMRHVGEDSVAVRGTGGDGCVSRLISPKPTAQAVFLARAMDRNATPDATLGRVFAERIEVTCR
ncbi:MAG: DUF1007 family protein [Pseudomonadota bacterium]